MTDRNFFTELRRRHVYRVAIAYVVVSWLLLQLAAILFPAFGAPHWAIRLLFAFLVIGFLVALLLAWAFEITPEGVRRTEPAEAEAARTPAQRRHVGRRIDFVIIAVLVAAVGVLVWRLSLKPKPTAAANVAAASAASSTKAAVAATKIPAKSIAVLPFENLSSDQANAYFAEGMQDLILTKLADIGDLAVISRTSTMQYGSHPENLQKVGEQLGVATILEGSVQRIGDQVLVNVQLIDAHNDHHIWAQSYQRTLKNVFGVEGEVATKIASTLNAKLSPAESRRLATTLSPDPKANDLYLRAEYFINRNLAGIVEPAEVKKAISLYQQALARVPDFALAHARLSFAYSLLVYIGGGGENVKQLTADAYAQAKQAMKLAPNMPESHVAIGYYDYYGKGDYDAALKAFAAALKIRPNNAPVYASRGYVLRRQGKFEKAIEALKRASVLDPRSVMALQSLAMTYMAINRYPKADQVSQEAIALDPENESSQIEYAISILLGTGDLSRTLAALQGNGAAENEYRAALLATQRKFGAAIALIESTPGKSFGPHGPKNLMLGDLYHESGAIHRARTYYAKALPELRAQLPALAGQPLQIANVWNNIADAEIGLGKTHVGIAAIKAALAAGEKSGDHYAGPSVVAQAAENYAEAGRADKAVSLISRALATPGIGVNYSPVLLWLDPELDPIRNTPEFQALLKKYAKYKPATVPTVGSAPAAATAPAS